jgi:hypothetical protein
MPDQCIQCKSEDITAEPGETEGNVAWFDVSCNKCGTKWREHYKLTRVERDGTEEVHMNIVIKEIQSHRNGVSGNHFFSVFFTFNEDGQIHDLIGIVMPGAGNCFIVSKDYPEKCWRGDHFEPDLKEAVSQWTSKMWNHPIEKARKDIA